MRSLGDWYRSNSGSADSWPPFGRLAAGLRKLEHALRSVTPPALPSYTVQGGEASSHLQHMQIDSAINHGPHVVKIAIQRERERQW